MTDVSIRWPRSVQHEAWRQELRHKKEVKRLRKRMVRLLRQAATSRSATPSRFADWVGKEGDDAASQR